MPISSFGEVLCWQVFHFYAACVFRMFVYNLQHLVLHINRNFSIFTLSSEYRTTGGAASPKFAVCSTHKRRRQKNNMGILDFFRKRKPNATISIREITDEKDTKEVKPYKEKKVRAAKPEPRPKPAAPKHKKEKQYKERPPKKEVLIDESALIENFPPDEWEPEIPEAAEGKVRFSDMDLPVALLHGIHDVGFSYCTDIQSEILPHSLKGLDVTGKAQTGTGKTAAFLLTILSHLINTKPAKARKIGAPRALVMAPTRELVMQIDKDAKELAKYCGAEILAVFGGMDYEKQRNILQSGHVDIVIATPGRILDYYKQKIINLNNVEILVLDEADRMLDMGFLPDMRRIIDAVPSKSSRQTMLFSATLVPEILRLASMWTNDPVKIEIEPDQITSADVEQIAYIVSKEDKFNLLYNMLTNENITRAIIFANRRDEVRTLTSRLDACGFSCGMLTGDVSQVRRIKTLEKLRDGSINVLIATDVAGRGIHVEGVEVVINYNLPEDPDDYVHRIGRTGRAGSKGKSVAFATEEDSYVLPNIEAHIREQLNYVVPEEELLVPIPEEFMNKVKSLRSEKRSKGGRPRKAPLSRKRTVKGK